jgi:hypothetical protein
MVIPWFLCPTEDLQHTHQIWGVFLSFPKAMTVEFMGESSRQNSEKDLLTEAISFFLFFSRGKANQAKNLNYKFKKLSSVPCVIG